MRYFLDTEFNERPGLLELISLALVAEDGREYYAVSSEWQRENTNPFVQAHVLPLLPPWCQWKPRSQIRQELTRFLAGDPAPRFWGYHADYDWVNFCWLFGTMVDLPSRFPKYCMDLKQWAVDLGNPELPPQESAEHDALMDARWMREAWQFLEGLAHPFAFPAGWNHRCRTCGGRNGLIQEARVSTPSYQCAACRGAP